MMDKIQFFFFSWNTNEVKVFNKKEMGEKKIEVAEFWTSSAIKFISYAWTWGS